MQIFDVFGEAIHTDSMTDLFTTSETDLDRQLRAADAKMGGCGFHLAYGRKYFDLDNLNAFKIDCILFAFDSECIVMLNQYAEKKFHELNDQYRIHKMVAAGLKENHEKISLVVTAPPSFAIQSKITKAVVEDMLNGAQASILITGYSLSDYFEEMVELIIRKSQLGVFVKSNTNRYSSS